MIEYTRKLHERLINIETISENLKIACIIMFIFGFVITIILSISLNLELLKPLEYFGIMTVYIMTIFFLYILSVLYPLAVLNLTFGKDKKWVFLYDDIEKIFKKLEKDVEKEEIPKKDFKEALYIRSKYYFEDEVPEIIKGRKEAAKRQEERDRKRMQEFSDKYSGKLDLKKEK